VEKPKEIKMVEEKNDFFPYSLPKYESLLFYANP
jgi:hypothetical protein